MKNQRAIIPVQTSATHTPGPWHHNPAVVYLENGIWKASVINDEAEAIALVCAGKREIASANARLIAAAPALLEALKDCERLLSLLNAPGTNDPIESAVFKARAAIQSATL